MAGDGSKQSRVIPVNALFVWFAWITAGCAECSMSNNVHCLLVCCKDEGKLKQYLLSHCSTMCISVLVSHLYESDKVWRVNIIDFFFSPDQMSDKLNVFFFFFSFSFVRQCSSFISTTKSVKKEEKKIGHLFLLLVWFATLLLIFVF